MTHLISTRGDDRLCYLMRMDVESNLVKSFDLDELVDDFGWLRLGLRRVNHILTERFIAIRTFNYFQDSQSGMCKM